MKMRLKFIKEMNFMGKSYFKFTARESVLDRKEGICDKSILSAAETVVAKEEVSALGLCFSLSFLSSATGLGAVSQRILS